MKISAGGSKNAMTIKNVFSAMLAIGLATSLRAADSAGVIREFDFSAGGISPASLYSPAAGFGFDLGSKVKKLPGGGVTSDRPFFFSVALPEGNYCVTAVFGDRNGGTTNTVKAEARRLMLEKVMTASGEMVTRRFVVNTRTVNYSGGQVHLKAREKTTETVTWDDKLTLEFNGARPGLQKLEISPATNATTVFIAGDSTVCDQPLEPWNSWGQMLPRFF